MADLEFKKTILGTELTIRLIGERLPQLFISTNPSCNEGDAKDIIQFLEDMFELHAIDGVELYVGPHNVVGIDLQNASISLRPDAAKKDVYNFIYHVVGPEFKDLEVGAQPGATFLGQIRETNEICAEISVDMGDLPHVDIPSMTVAGVSGGGREDTVMRGTILISLSSTTKGYLDNNAVIAIAKQMTAALTSIFAEQTNRPMAKRGTEEDPVYRAICDAMGGAEGLPDDVRNSAARAVFEKIEKLYIRHGMGGGPAK